jgi:hypothetical protein
MIKSCFFLFVFLCSLHSFSQKLIYNSNGNILNSENQKITPDQVRELLVNNEQLLADYNAGRSKKTAGNILMTFGIGAMLTDLIVAATTGGGVEISYDNTLKQKRYYPTALTYLGAGLFIVAIPVKIGFSKKIRNVVTEYNTQKATGNLDLNKQKLDFITNSNGVGFRLTLN